MKSKKATRHTYAEIMKQLEAGGSAQTRKTYRRHGIQGDLFGVSYATLKALDKKVIDDSELADKLWASGNHDARVFACWVAEEDKLTMKQLEAWARDVIYHGLGGELVSLAAFSRFGPRLSAKWRKSTKDLRSAMGWGIVSNLALQPDRSAADGGLTDDDLLACLDEIEAKIHAAPNRTRSYMNSALIGIGCRPSTSKAALAVAKRVGPVIVDQGDTSCKTPVALAQIKKTLAHYQARGKVPTDGAGGLRRRHC